MAKEDTEPKYPEIKVQLTEEGSNAFTMIGRTGKELRRAGVADEEIRQFQNEATAGDYDHVIQTIMEWVTVR